MLLGLSLFFFPQCVLFVAIALQARFPEKPGSGIKRLLFDDDASAKRWWRFVLEFESDGMLFVNSHSVSFQSKLVWNNKPCNNELGEALKKSILHKCLDIYSCGASGLVVGGKPVVMGGDWNFKSEA